MTILYELAYCNINALGYSYHYHLLAVRDLDLKSLLPSPIGLSRIWEACSADDLCSCAMAMLVRSHATNLESRIPSVLISVLIYSILSRTLLLLLLPSPCPAPVFKQYGTVSALSRRQLCVFDELSAL